MPRKNKSFLGRRSGALDVQGEVCLDNPGVVIDRMTPLGSYRPLLSIARQQRRTLIFRFKMVAVYGGTMKRSVAKALGLLLLALPLPLAAQDLASFEKRVTVKTLPNGLTVLILRRPEAPVVSFFTMVYTGSSQDPLSKTGLPHMMEHMAFKGTPDIGTTNYTEEKVALAKVEQAYAAYDAERIKSVGKDPRKLAQLQKEWQEARQAAEQHKNKKQFGEIGGGHGGVGMNAFTNYDETGYLYSMPSNMIELWAAIESDRMLHPVMRRLYKARSVGMEDA